MREVSRFLTVCRDWYEAGERARIVVAVNFFEAVYARSPEALRSITSPSWNADYTRLLSSISPTQRIQIFKNDIFNESLANYTHIHLAVNLNHLPVSGVSEWDVINDDDEVSNHEKHKNSVAQTKKGSEEESDCDWEPGEEELADDEVQYYGGPLQARGRSRLGGEPDLPPHMRTWPEDGSEQNDFFCQINLQELSYYNPFGLLPYDGMLYFFRTHVLFSDTTQNLKPLTTPSTIEPSPIRFINLQFLLTVTPKIDPEDFEEGVDSMFGYPTLCAGPELVWSTDYMAEKQDEEGNHFEPDPDGKTWGKTEALLLNLKQPQSDQEVEQLAVTLPWKELQGRQFKDAHCYYYCQ